jgi:hypothetical protein
VVCTLLAMVSGLGVGIINSNQDTGGGGNKTVKTA